MPANCYEYKENTVIIFENAYEPQVVNKIGWNYLIECIH